MKQVLRNAVTLVRRPALALEYASWIMQKAFRSAGPLQTICGARIGGFNGFSEYHSVGRGVSTGECEFLRTYPFGDGAVIDIGANLGLFSLVAHNVMARRRIIAFEPAPSTFAALTKNVARNRATIECHPLAVSDRDGTAAFVIRENARANSSLAAETTAPGANSADMRCVTLDRFVSEAQLTQIALLKVDVEGFEASVFKGAARVLSHLRPQVVYFEVCPPLACAAGFEPGEAAALLRGSGYVLSRILPDGTLRETSRQRIEEVALENWVGTLPR